MLIHVKHFYLKEGIASLSFQIRRMKTATGLSKLSIGLPFQIQKKHF